MTGSAQMPRRKRLCSWVRTLDFLRKLQVFCFLHCSNFFTNFRRFQVILIKTQLPVMYTDQYITLLILLLITYFPNSLNGNHYSVTGLLMASQLMRGKCKSHNLISTSHNIEKQCKPHGGMAGARTLSTLC